MCDEGGGYFTDKSSQSLEQTQQNKVRWVVPNSINIAIIAINAMIGDGFNISMCNGLRQTILRELCEINMKEDTSINERNLCKDILKVFLLGDKTITAKLKSKLNDPEMDKIKKIGDEFAEHVSKHFFGNRVESKNLIFFNEL